MMNTNTANKFKTKNHASDDAKQYVCVGNLNQKTNQIQNMVCRPLSPDDAHELGSFSGQEILGWWENTIKGNSHNTTRLWNIYRSGSNLRVKLYAGNNNRYREWTPEDFDLLQFQAHSFWGQYQSFNTDDFPLVPDVPGSWLLNPTSPMDASYLSPQQRTARLNVSETSRTILYVYMFDLDRGNIYPECSSNTLKLVKLRSPPQIESFTNPSSIDNTNPINILTEVFYEFLVNGNPQTAEEYQPTEFKDITGFYARRKLLLTTGISYGPNPIKDVWRTRTDFPTFFPFPLSTTFITERPPNARIGARGVVSGFQGAYAILNNSIGWELGIADNDNGISGIQAYDSKYYMGSKEKFMVTVIDVDTSALVPYNCNIHGIGSITIVVDPVTSNTEYRGLTAALHDLQCYVGRCTHTLIRPYVDGDTLRLYPTFAALQTGLTAGTASRFRMRSRGYNGTRSGALYIDAWYQDVVTFPSIPTNDPTGINLGDLQWINPDSPFFAYNIIASNYLDRSRTYNIYWGLSGPPIPGSPITTADLVTSSGGYYKTPGSKFIFQINGYYDPAPNPAIYRVYGDYADGYDYRNSLIFGIIDPALTCGKTIAYIYVVDAIPFDAAVVVSMTFNEFTDPSTGLPGALYPQLNCFAKILEKLNSFNPDSYIIDIRGNGGGSFSLGIDLASFFGKPRDVVNIKYTDSDKTVTHHQTSLQSIQNDADFKNLQTTINGSKVMYTNRLAQLFPNSVVRGSGKKVVVLTDTNSASAGDMYPHWFRDSSNPNRDFGDIGYGVRSYIIGDIDGRLLGRNQVTDTALSTNTNHNLYDSGLAVSAYRITSEVIASLFRAGNNSYPFSGQNEVIKPNKLMNFDIESDLWLNVGSKGTYPKNPSDGGNDEYVLPLSTGKTQPIYVNNTTWRDRGLEASIVTGVEPGRIRSCNEYTESRSPATKSTSISNIMHKINPLDIVNFHNTNVNRASK